MACGNCNNSTCTGCNVTCVPVGPTGPQGPIGATGPPASFLNSYVQSTSSVLLSSADVSWIADNTWYSPTGYTTFTYTNTSGVAKSFFIQVNYLSGTNDPANAGLTDVSCGIFMSTNLITPLYYTDSKTEYTENPAATILNYSIRNNGNIFYKVTLENNGTVLVQFKTKGTGAGQLQKAQMFIQEV